ncbi:hypothetical protein MNV_760003 [Candidatus Methanoperedens nitroreducens]|uniref:Uncharacterized protein n=1 Tax=Candidatus Methanoperedens nitratireducens TaxID=1392998 RepID=A0A284VTM2_9EURY|nr:hypothetical protein MNV_760003 [Candidatus Methanoperedens nitroreducens]
MEAIRPRFLVVKGFNYQFLATRQDQMNIRKYYDLVILKNDVYVFVLKSP